MSETNLIQCFIRSSSCHGLSMVERVSHQQVEQKKGVKEWKTIPVHKRSMCVTNPQSNLFLVFDMMHLYE